MNPNARAQELIELSHSMVQVMATEIEAIKNGNIAEIEPLQVQKEVLSQIYESQMRDVSADPGALAAIDPNLRVELARASAQLNETAAENKNAVQAALELNVRLVQVIADAVTKSAPSAAGYTNTGAAPAATPRAAPAAKPATLNRSL